MDKRYGTCDVCTDCYIAHHYGYRTEHDPDTGEPVCYAGESDTPADQEPLALLAGWELSDAYDPDTHDEYHFSRSWCMGCGSRLGGDRHPLVVMRPLRGRSVVKGGAQ
jgi:hypothetical protein